MMGYSTSATNALIPESAPSSPHAAQGQPQLNMTPVEAHTLFDIATGTSAVVIGLEAEPPLNRRLRELGFRPGTQIRVGHRTVGSDRVVSIGGMRYALDHHTLKAVKVV